MKIDHNAASIIDNLTSQLKTSSNAKNLNKNSDMENSLLEGESAAVIAGAKILKDNGYELDKNSIDKLKDLMNGDKSKVSAKLSALETAIQKDMPIEKTLIDKIELSNNLSMLDFLDDLSLMSLHKPKKNEASNPNREKSISRKLDRTENLLKNIFEIAENFQSKLTANKNTKELPTKSIFNDMNQDEFNLFKNELEFKLKQTFAHSTENDKKKLDYQNSETKKIHSEYQKDLDMLANYLNASQNINQNSSVSAFLEVRITQKLLDLKNDFINLKREIRLNLEKINPIDKNISKSEKLELLSKTIEKLDSAIMKSEMSLYIDMKGERELIKISSELQVAKTAVEQGDVKSAEKILKYANVALENLKFEPSIKKAFAIITNKDLAQTPSIKELQEWIKESSEKYVDGEKSVSTLINYLRKTGINHDVEQFQNFQAFKTDNKLAELKEIVNIKDLILKMNQDSGDKKLEKHSQQILEIIEGKQLKNKITNNKSFQTVELELPIKLSGRIKNVKVFIKSPQKMLKLDWENFDMYFVLNSDKMGEMGIRVNSIQRKISVKIFNDKIDNINKNSKIDSNLKSEVKEFGYTLVKMITEAWNKKSKSVISNTENTKSSDAKFDLLV